MTEPSEKKCHCGKTASLNRHCGAYVCECGNHIGMVRCYCGWSISGGDGYRELVEEGETIELEDY